jgi:lipopolysaccharide transport system permease protein
MASVTHPNVAFPLRSSAVRIEPPRGLFELRFGEVWAYRELLYFFVWRDVKIRYKQTAIGVLWVVLQPVLTMLVFTLFFGRLAKLPSQGLPYPVFYFTALAPWTYFAYALQMTTNVVVDNQRLITKVYFPRLILPISSALSGLADFAVFTALGVGLWLSALNALYSDVRYVIQFWMFAFPVAYPASLVPSRWRWLYGLNPMTGVIEGFRWALTGLGRAARLGDFGIRRHGGVMLFGGLIYFNRMESTIADVV